MTLYPQSIPAESSQPEYFVARCMSKHVFVAPMDYRGGICPVCEHKGRPYVPPDQYPCKHCGEFPRDHAVIEHRWGNLDWLDHRAPSKLACLFSPTRFEPLTQEELEASR